MRLLAFKPKGVECKYHYFALCTSRSVLGSLKTSIVHRCLPSVTVFKKLSAEVLRGSSVQISSLALQKYYYGGFLKFDPTLRLVFAHSAFQWQVEQFAPEGEAH